MDSSRRSPGSPLVAAMLGSAVLGGQYVAGTAARDALFLAHFDTSSLPAMVMVSAAFSIALVIASARALRHVSPGSWVPVAFVATGVLILGEWVLASSAPRLAAPTLYLVVSGVGPMLGSAFWLIANERIDPRTAKRVFGRIAGAGTLGGLLVGLGAARVAAAGGVGAILPLLAGLNLAAAWLIWRLARFNTLRGADQGPATAPPTRSALRVLASAPYLRHLVALVLLGAVSATLVDQAFKTEVKAALGSGESLGSFFSLYHAALNVITFVIQAGGSGYVLEKLGLSAATATPALAVLAGGAGALAMPGVTSLVVTRAGEAVSRASIYRAGYEVFFTPLAPNDKRAVKAIVDVGIDKTGDMVGATLAQQVLWLPPPGQTTVLLSLAMGCAGVALFIAHRLARGYVQALERSLLSRAVALDLSDVEDLTTRTAVLRTLQMPTAGAPAHAASPAASPPRERPPHAAANADADIARLRALQSRDPEIVRRVLRDAEGLSAALVPHVIALLAWDDVSDDCVRALQSVAEQRIGELIDALADPNQPYAVRRRLARVFSVCVSQRAADGLLIGLEDLRFDVRYQSGRSLLAIVTKNPAICIDKARIFALVNDEVAVSKDVWESRRALDGLDEGDGRSFLEDLVRERASQSLAHVFTLLALVLPTEPLRIAFRGLHTDDQDLRGTALEYLESVLPRDIRDRLWPFLEDRRRPSPAQRPGQAALEDLLRSNESIRVNLEELKRIAARGNDA